MNNPSFPHGATLLDYFAGQCLAGLFAGGSVKSASPALAAEAFGMAVMMLEQRKAMEPPCPCDGCRHWRISNFMKTMTDTDSEKRSYAYGRSS